MAIGEAYGFLHYDGGQSDISKQLAGFKEDEALPQGLSFEVGETERLNAQGDSALEAILQLAKQANRNYTIKATSPGEVNESVAEHVAGAMMWINGTLFGKDEPFHAEVVYKEGEGYVRMQK